MELLLASEQGRPEQSDVVLQDLVNIGNFKQALANVDKRLRKGKKDKLLVITSIENNEAIPYHFTRSTGP